MLPPPRGGHPRSPPLLPARRRCSGANETLTLTLVPKKHGKMRSARARLRYTDSAAEAAAAAEAPLDEPPAAGVAQVLASSTSAGTIEIMTVPAYERATAATAVAQGAAAYFSAFVLVALPFWGLRAASAREWPARRRAA